MPARSLIHFRQESTTTCKSINYGSGKDLDYATAVMTEGRLIQAAVTLVLAIMINGHASSAQQPEPPLTFRSSVDVVRVSAVVRDQRGRFVQDLQARDFEILDGGHARPITDFRKDPSGVSVALLFDVSGSMEGKLADAREAARHLLSWLDPQLDEAAIFTFDTQLEEAAPFTSGLTSLPDRLSALTPYGATSLHDAIAQTAERSGLREGRRRAVVVFTDGDDTASRMAPSQVSSIASAIDVPVYVFGVVKSIDNPVEDIAAATNRKPALSGSVADLATWTGGHVFVASTAAQRSLAARRIVDELRHQYLIAFESSGKPGWHPLEVRARAKDLIVRARSGYIAGQSRPNSQ
jgi:Ca-activated chloride channel family protein